MARTQEVPISETRKKRRVNNIVSIKRCVCWLFLKKHEELLMWTWCSIIMDKWTMLILFILWLKTYRHPVINMFLHLWRPMTTLCLCVYSVCVWVSLWQVWNCNYIICITIHNDMSSLSPYSTLQPQHRQILTKAILDAQLERKSFKKSLIWRSHITLYV